MYVLAARYITLPRVRLAVSRRGGGPPSARIGPEIPGHSVSRGQGRRPPLGASNGPAWLSWPDWCRPRAMEILMVSAELGHHARVSAAADSVSALAKALRQHGHTVTLALPRYPSFDGSGLLLARRLSPLVIEPGVEVTVLDGQLASGVALVLVDAPAFAEGRPIFGEPGTPDGEADGARTALLCRAAVALVRERKLQGRAVDVVHLHDWAAAPVAALLARDGAPPTVLTVHSETERTFSVDGLALLGDVLDEARARVDGRVSPLRLGLLHAGAVTTVSPGFARELESEPPFRVLRSPLVGILDGLDYA